MHDATGGQYGADVAPWLAWAALYGAFHIQQGLGRLWPAARPHLANWIGASLLGVALIWQVFRGYSPLALDPPHWDITAHDRLAQRFLAQIPPEAAVSAQGKLYPHLSNRPIAYQLPDVHEADYVFFDVTANTWPIHPQDLKTRLEELLHSGEFGVLDGADGYLLLRRGLVGPTPPDAFYDFARIPGPQPQYPLQVEFGDELRLLGFDLLDDPRREETAVRLYWQALRPLERDLRLYTFFVNAAGEVVENTEQRPLLTQLWYPPRQWRPGETVMAETLPWALGEQWSLAAGVLTGSEWTDWSQRLSVQVVDAPTPLRRFEAHTWVRLATFARQGRQLVEVAPVEPAVQPAHPLQANLANKMELRGYELSPATGQPGQALTVTLYWQALAAMPLDYTVFVHLIGPDGHLAAQQDSQPWWDVPLPTSTWQPGETLPDRHTLTLPADLVVGSYRLQVGVYYWETLERLPVIKGNVPVSNFVELGNITVE
jgi:hypothetical protein